MSGPTEPTHCPGCGSPIWIAETDDGERVPLETYAELTGPDRYTVLRERDHANGDPHIVVKVAAHVESSAFPDHRTECRDFGDGRGGRRLV